MGMADPLAVTLNPDYSQARGRKEMFDRFRERGEMRPNAERSIGNY
jgi:hypothetical protein